VGAHSKVAGDPISTNIVGTGRGRKIILELKEVTETRTKQLRN